MRSSVPLVVVAVAFGGCGARPLDGAQAPGGAGAGAGAGGAAGFAGSTGAGGWTIVPNCGSLIRSVVPATPEVLLVLDRSASMKLDAAGNDCGGDCGATSRWARLTGAVGAVVAASPATVHWGLKPFADVNSTCGVSGGVAVPVGASNAAAIAAAIAGWTSASGSLQSAGQSPLRGAVLAAVAYLSAQGDRNPKLILLATDGLPNCSPGNADINAADVAGAVDAVATARRLGFLTAVIAPAPPPGSPAEATLGALADAGGMPRAGTPPYYSNETSSELAGIFLNAVSTGTSCSLALPAAPSGDTNRPFIDVFIDGLRVPYDVAHVDGWDYTDATQAVIQIYGPFCAGLIAGTAVQILVTFRCADH